MSYDVNWISKVISIPTTDLTLISGTHYKLSMTDFLGEIRRLEYEFSDGLWAPQILDHTNIKMNFAGVNYAGFDEIINGYTIQFTGAVTRVDLRGSNNNIIDVLIVTGVSVVPNNSAGLQIVSSSGVTPQDVWEYGTRTLTAGTRDAEIDGINNEYWNKKVLTKISDVEYREDLYDDAGTAIVRSRILSKVGDVETRE